MSASSRMWIGLLGPLDVRVDGATVPVTASRLRAVLGSLLVRANEVVSFEELADLVWDGSPPRTARVTLRNHVRRLRVTFGPGLADRIVTCDPGYLFEIGAGELDLLEFAGLCGTGLAAMRAGEWQRGSEALGRALGLWRGPALVDIPPDALHREDVPRLERMRVQAVEWRADAEMRRGGHDAVVDEVRAHLVRHPTHEGLHARLMLALARCGRRAEALEAYRQARELIVGELGVEPNRELRDLHQRILQADPALDADPEPEDRRPGPDPGPDADPDLTPGPGADRVERSADARPARPAAEVPRQLPAPVRNFTGRAEQVEFLSNLARRGSADTAPAQIIPAVDGMAGVGKTALVVQVAHRLAGDYPDGQLFVDLHGFTEGVAPAEPGAALDGMLRALGMIGERIPDAVEERAALLRTRLAGKRMLIVLDNAATEAQVRPLLPGHPGCLVLVTSRRRLTGLDDVEPLPLDVLPVSEAAALFIRTVGSDRIAAADSALVHELVELCGRLPLAIRIAAARLRHQPGWRLAELADLLRDEHGPLPALRAGERSVAVSVHLSYTGLAAEQRRMFQLLGLYPGADADPYAAAALAASSRERASGWLEDLCDAHLLDQPTPRRYRMHDLVHAHASHLAHAELSERDSRAALSRLLDHYAHAATEAARALYPHESIRSTRLPRPDTPTPVLADRTRAASWLDSELGNLLTAATHAADNGWPAHTVALAGALHPFLQARSRYAEAGVVHQHALAAADRTGDRQGTISALVNLGRTRYRQSRYGLAEDLYQQAVLLARDTGDRVGEVRALTGLGQIHHVYSLNEQAADEFTQARQLATAIHHRAGEVGALLGLGHLHRALGQYEQAVPVLERTLRIAGEIGHQSGECGALMGLGLVHYLQGGNGQAGHCLEQALTIAAEVGDRPGELNALLGLGHVYRASGRYERATRRFERALNLAARIGDRYSELAALNGLGLVHCLPGRYEQAATCYGQALHIARDLAVPSGELLALVGLGQVHRVRARYADAVSTLEHAMTIAREIGDRNAEFEVLSGLGRTHHAAGRADQALVDHHAALRIASGLEQRADQARAHDGIAHAEHALGHTDRAHHHWRSALDILSELGLSQAEEISAEDLRGHLAGTARPS